MLLSLCVALYLLSALEFLCIRIFARALRQSKMEEQEKFKIVRSQEN